jgi:hypothetical protein
MKEKSPEAVPQKENSPEPAIPSTVHEPVTDAPPSPRPIEPVHVASPVNDANPSQQNVSEEGEIPQSEHQVSPSCVETNESVPPSEPQPTVEEHPHQSQVPDKVSAPSPLRISLNTSKRTSDVGPSVVKTVCAHHSDSVFYGDEVISIEDELKYPYPHEQLPLFSIGVGVKGPLFNRNTHPRFFQESPYSKPSTSESPQFWTQE